MMQSQTRPALTLMEQLRTLAMPDGVRIAYRIAAAPQSNAGRAVVLLHGLASNMTRFSEFVERTHLTDALRVVRVDLRGHGESPTRGRIGLEQWSADLARLLDAEGVRRAVLVGHSLGAQVAMHFAARAPQRLAGLALIDPVFRAALHGKWRLLAGLAPLFRAAAAAVRGLNTLGLRRRRLPALDLRALDEKAREALTSKEAEAEFVRRYSSTRADLRTFHTAHYLQELVEMFRPLPDPSTYAMPVLVLLSLGGTFSGVDATRAIARRFPRGRVQTIDCHHWPLTERPDDVRRAIEDWCSDCETVEVG
ncbi:MAG TPA: alpha/beta hydrolase [Burkholderiaceae bacterium]|nr:alpha/beta hydrolase [Burkholderiaceae bacterium]